MPINPKIEHRERARIDDPQPIRLPHLERQRRVLVEAYGGGGPGGGGTGYGAEVGRVFGEVDYGGIWACVGRERYPKREGGRRVSMAVRGIRGGVRGEGGGVLRTGYRFSATWVSDVDKLIEEV